MEVTELYISSYLTCSWWIANFHRKSCDVAHRPLSTTTCRGCLPDNICDSDPAGVNVTESSDVHDDILAVKVRFLHGWELEGYDDHIHCLDINGFRSS